MKQHRLLLSICGFIFAAGLALGLARWSSPVYANVTLLGFTATYLPEQQAMRIDWETGTELNTAGFYVARGNSFTGPFGRVSPYISHEGGDLVGATYVFTDSIPVVNRFYYYRLEEVNNNQGIEYYDPITATAGVPATPTFTPTGTRTPTFTPTRTPTSTPSSTPTATPTTQPSTKDSATSGRRIEATPRVPTGSTITPQPTFTSPAPSPVAFPATSTLASAPASSQPKTPLATPVTLLSNVSPVATAVPPIAMYVAQASAPSFASAQATPGVVAPVVVATEAAPRAGPADSTLGEALLLIVAAILFLGIAFVILRQVRQ